MPTNVRVLLAALLIVFVQQGSAGAQTVSDPMLQVTPLLPNSSLDQPTTMAFVAPGDILVLEKMLGRVRERQRLHALRVPREWPPH